MIEKDILFRHFPFTLSVSDIDTRMGFGEEIPPKDEAFLKTICDYYHERKDNKNVTNKTVWEMNLKGHERFEQALKSYNIDEVHLILSHMFSTPITHGTIQGHAHYKQLLNNPESRKVLSHLIFDNLFALMEYYEVIDVFSPEEYAFEPRWLKKYVGNQSPDFYLSELEKKYKFNASSPRYVCNLFGLKTEHGLYTQRDFWSLGIALEIARYAKNNPGKVKSICEIGGGVGHLAYYLTRLGFNDISIVDLPTISVSQMYFLGTNLPEHNVKLLPPTQFTGDFDFIVNVDSFVEMSKQVALDYLKKIRKKSVLLSINHERAYPDNEEKSFTVSELCEKAGFKKISRDLFWLRKGYVKEIYVKK